MKKSFTIIELLVVISIMLIFTGITLAQYNTYAEQTKLKKALSADLFDRNCTNFSGYRVVISSGSYLLSFGCALAYSTVQNYNLTTNITVTTGTGNYNFSPLMINPSFISNTIRFKNSVISKCVDISVSVPGIFELDETLIGC